MDTDYSGRGRRGGGGGWGYDRGGRDGGYRGGRSGGRGYNNYDSGWGRGGGGGRGYNDRGYNDGWAGGGRGNYNNNYDDGFRGGGRGGRRGGSYQNWGNRNYRNNTWELRAEKEEKLPADVAALTELVGHTGKISTIQFEPQSQQLFTGATDGTVRIWDTVSGQCKHTLTVGGEVDSMLISGGFLFVGLHKAGEGIIKVWNMAANVDHLLTGHKGAVLCMCVVGSSLVSGGQDNTIRVWNFNQAAGIFMSQAIITKDEGGHNASVLALTVVGSIMFSADRVGNILVWDLGQGQAVQRIPSAHGDQSVMQLLAYDNYLFSAGMDGMIKAWAVLDPPQGPGMVLRPEPELVFDKDNQEAQDAQGQQQMGGRRRGRPTPGIITMQGTTDAAGMAVLMVSYNSESVVRLIELPSLNSRGCLTPAGDTRALGSVPGLVMLTGDSSGKVRIFKWNA